MGAALYALSGREFDVSDPRIAQGYGTLIEACAKPLDVRLSAPVTLINSAGPRMRVTTPQARSRRAPR